MIRRPPRSTLDRSSAASDVYKRQIETNAGQLQKVPVPDYFGGGGGIDAGGGVYMGRFLSLIHISEPTRPY